MLCIFWFEPPFELYPPLLLLLLPPLPLLDAEFPYCALVEWVRKRTATQSAKTGDILCCKEEGYKRNTKLQVNKTIYTKQSRNKKQLLK